MLLNTSAGSQQLYCKTTHNIFIGNSSRISSAVFSRILFAQLKMLITLFIFLFIQGFVWSEDDYKKYDDCENILDPVFNKTFRDVIPDAEEVLYRCPFTKEFLDCRITYFQPEFEELLNLGDFIIAKNFLEKMCDENSYVFKVYVANLDCYRSMVDEWDECKKIAADVFSEYRESSYAFHTDIEELDEDEREHIKQYRADIEPHCLTRSYTSACIGTKVLETCGSETFNTFHEIFVGLRFGNHVCGQEEENPFMKGFVDFLASENKLVESVLVRTLFEVDDD